MYVPTVRVVKIFIYLNLKYMLDIIRAVVWIIGLNWLFTSKDAKPARKYIMWAIIGSWIMFIIIGALCALFLPDAGVDTSRVNGW